MADCISYKIDSNVTGLAFAEEVCAKQLPTILEDGHDPTWHELEPNSYDDFGGEITTLARTPIKRNRQRSKGSTVDLDAAGGFNQDFTQNNHNRLMQGFFFANMREKPATYLLNGDQIVITGVTTASDRFESSGNGLENRGFKPGMLVFAEGFTNPANNGLHLVDEVEDGYVGVTTNLVDETPDETATLTAVGWQLAANDASITMSSNIPTLHLATAAVAADATLTFAGNAVADETVTIGAVVYTFKAAAAAPYEVTIGGSAAATIVNLVATINGENALTPDAHPLVEAADGAGDTVVITAIIPGTTGNGIDTAETMTAGSWDGATAGGTGFSFLALGVVEGEWMYVGGDATINKFVNNQGFARIAAGGLSDTDIIFDKTTWEAEAEAAAGLTIRVFVGDHLRNEPDPDDIVTRYFQFERALGNDDDGVQSEYILGAVGNELSINVEAANKVTVDLGFMAADSETRTGLEGLKDGDRVAAFAEDFFNSASDIVRMHLGVISETDSSPTSLFGYATEASITINNNVSIIKAIGALGGIDVNVGNFEVGGEVTALFTNVLAIRAIRQNSDVTFDLIAAKQNGGFVFDIPLLALGEGRPEIEANQPVMLPLEQMGAESEFGTTLSYTNFRYLPDAAMPEGVLP